MTTTTPPPGPVLDTAHAPTAAARMVEAAKPDLLLTQEHHMCPGCGEPVAVRQFLETAKRVRAVDLVQQLLQGGSIRAGPRGQLFVVIAEMRQVLIRELQVH